MIKMKICLTLFLIISVSYSYQRSTPEDDSYVGAVVEFQVNRSSVQQNIEQYAQLMQQAADQNADILVFPEMTLLDGSTSLVVPIDGLLKQYPIPALNPELYDPYLVSLSAAARTAGIYVVVNIREKLDCTTTTEEYCPEQKVYMFNTNVVFDRNGAVIDRYRKINLFGEFSHTPALRPDLGIFTTDFGVTFGHFICFDLMFQVPAVQVVEKNNITNVLFSSMWFSEMPYLTAVEIQEAYAYSLNVNMLAAGANNVRIGSAGSGIYSGKAGALISIMPGVPTTRMLVARVPKVPGQVTGDYPGPIYDNPEDHDELLLIRDPSLPSHVTRLLEPGFNEFTLVDKDVSCRFTVRLTPGNADLAPRFRAFAQDGSNTYARRELGVAACTVVACKTSDVKTCSDRYSPSTADEKIETLEIKMTTYQNWYNTTLHCDNIVYFPISLTTDKFPLGPQNYTITESQQNGDVTQNGVEFKNGREHVTMKLNVPQDNLISFGLWGRIFTRDVDHNDYKNVTQEDLRKFETILDKIYGVVDSNKVD